MNSCRSTLVEQSAAQRPPRR